MVAHVKMSRRRFLGSAGTALAAPALAATTLSKALAQTSAAAPAAVSRWRQLGALTAEAQKLGLFAPQVSATLTGGDEFDRVMPAVVDFIDAVQASANETDVPAADVARLLGEADALLRQLTQAERSPRTDRDNVTGAAAVTRPTFESLREEYNKLFATCTVRTANAAEVNWYIGKLTSDDYKEQYLTVGNEVCAPWYFVGIIHAMEASFNFQGHLHNGDSLSEKTVHVPKGRPTPWDPPNDWASSAEDALTFDGLANQADWSLAHTLYRFESYNGFGSRRNGINTPYLWSYSNQYTKGKFVADGVWDANAVSKQCGAAVMLKVLVDRGLTTLPS